MQLLPRCCGSWQQPHGHLVLGLPRLPVADLPDYAGDIVEGSLQWKTKALVRIADGRPFVWIDDVIGEADRWFVEVGHAGEALLHKVDAAVGVTADDLALIAAWVRDVER
jgi:hypothetical protein